MIGNTPEINISSTCVNPYSGIKILVPLTNNNHHVLQQTDKPVHDRESIAVIFISCTALGCYFLSGEVSFKQNKHVNSLNVTGVNIS